MPEMIRRHWVARVRRIRFTGPATADVIFSVESAGGGPTFEGTVRRHGNRWTVTRDTMVTALA